MEFPPCFQTCLQEVIWSLPGPAQSFRHVLSITRRAGHKVLDGPLSSLHDPVRSAPPEVCVCLPTTRTSSKIHPLQR